MSKHKQYVNHPRYGSSPQVTGLHPNLFDRQVNLHWNTTTSSEIARKFEALTGKKWEWGDSSVYARDIKRIPNTAVVADISRQTSATIPVTHYFDLERPCRDCGLLFIFFAEEQKHWYEELGFGLDSDCVRCVPCRKRQQGVARKRERYEELFHVPARTADEDLEMAECCLALIEASVFHRRQTQRVRMLLNRMPAERDPVKKARCADLTARILVIENQGDHRQADTADPR